jgi:membrane peptidoglycan carboxypeptidase
MIQAYTVFASGGKLVDLQAISQVRNAKGEVVRDRQMEQRRVIHEQTAYLVTDMLKTVMSSGTAASVRSWGMPHRMAGKTGTTNDFKDAWFIGYTPDLICLVWVGYDDNTPVRMTGAQAALPIWSRFMKEISPRLSTRDFPRPRGIVERMIDPYTGKLASYSCPYAQRELFIAGTEPYYQCTDADHYLPIEHFLGPQTRIQHAQYYTWEPEDSSELSNIMFDNSTGSYTNYNWETNEFTDTEESGYEDSEPVDYSDVTFGEQNSDSETTDNEDQPEESVEPESNQLDPVFNDFESPEPLEEESGEGQIDAVSGEQSPAAVYMAPAPKKKRKAIVFTNKDVAPAQTTTDFEDQD